MVRQGDGEMGRNNFKFRKDIIQNRLALLRDLEEINYPKKIKRQHLFDNDYYSCLGTIYFLEIPNYEEMEEK
ncbi:MAG: hypothetical protein AAGG00_19485 [Cyanobacteria bacterium P01_H01_bin.150]